MKQSIRLCMVILLTVMASCACRYPAEEPREIPGEMHQSVDLTEEETVWAGFNDQNEVREYMSRITAEYRSRGRMELDKRPLLGYSAEGGEITRYRDSSGQTMRYHMIYYGETGRREENYYFLSDDIYYTSLVENYSCPINVYSSPDILNREFEQGVLIDGVYYQYGEGEEGTIPYGSREEIDGIFELAGAEEGLELHFSDYRILAVNGYLLGGYYNNRWIGWEELYPMLPERDTYKIYVNGQYQGTESGQKEPETDEELYSGASINFNDSEYGFDGYNAVVAYSGSEDLQIESGTAISLENQLYINELHKYLLKMGLTEEFELTDIIKIDLDHDGQDEVFIQAYHQEDLANESTDIQYMRKAVDGKVESITVPIMDPAVSADHLTIIGFCDINGDGTKELLMSAMGIGYHDYMVYEFKNNEFTRVFENGGEH